MPLLLVRVDLLLVREDLLLVGDLHLVQVGHHLVRVDHHLAREDLHLVGDLQEAHLLAEDHLLAGGHLGHRDLPRDRLRVHPRAAGQAAHHKVDLLADRQLEKELQTIPMDHLGGILLGGVHLATHLLLVAIHKVVQRAEVLLLDMVALLPVVPKEGMGVLHLKEALVARHLDGEASRVLHSSKEDLLLAGVLRVAEREGHLHREGRPQEKGDPRVHLLPTTLCPLAGIRLAKLGTPIHKPAAGTKPEGAHHLRLRVITMHLQAGGQERAVLLLSKHFLLIKATLRQATLHQKTFRLRSRHLPSKTAPFECLSVMEEQMLLCTSMDWRS